MKNKIAIVGLAFIIQLAVHSIGGYYMTPILVRHISSVPFITLAMLSSSTLSLAVAIIFIARQAKFYPKFQIQRETLMYIFAGIVMAWLVAFSQAFLEGKEIRLAEEILKTTSPYLYLNLTTLVFIGPLLEEILYRGYFFELIRTTSNTKTALFASTLLFILPHGIWGGFNSSLLYIFLYSVVFTLMYIQGGLISSISVHSFVNCYLTYLNT